VELYWPPLAAAARLLVDAAPHPTSLAMFFFSPPKQGNKHES
jgi:hypothetical protein